jgi:ATP-dependent Lhr-like helicase
LQGIEMAAALWERRVLAGRVAEYEPRYLDELALGGELVWGRLRPPRRNEEDGPSSTVLTRAMPISLALRQDLNWLLPDDRATCEAALRSNATQVLEVLRGRGALFAHEIQGLTGLMPTHIDEALAELAALGLVTADGFAGIRKLVSRERTSGRRARMRRARPPAAAGRWSLFPGFLAPCLVEDRLQNWARLLLRRWGVLFRDLLVRETASPSWGQLVPVLRRLESQGEIRGGRFVAGVAGEQYALASAVERLRQIREAAPTGETIVVAASDPVNLCGVINDDPRIPAIHTNAVAVRDGKLVALWQSGEVAFHADLPQTEARELAWRLRRSDSPRPHVDEPMAMNSSESDPSRFDRIPHIRNDSTIQSH